MQCFKKRVIPFLLVVSILSSIVFSSLTVQANTGTDAFAMGTVLTKYIFSTTFGMAFKDFDEVVANSVELSEYIDYMEQKYADQGVAGSDIKIDAVDISKLQEVADAIILSNQGYYWVEPNYTVNDFLFGSSVPVDKQYYIDFSKKIFSSKKWLFLTSQSTSSRNCISYFVDDSKYDYLYCNSIPSTSVLLMGYNFSSGSVYYMTAYHFQDSSSTYNGSSYAVFPFKYAGSSPVKVFKSKSELIKYLNGVNSIYVSSGYKTHSGPLTVNWDKANSIDYVTLNKTMYDAISKALADAGGLGSIGDSAAQELIDQKLQEILGTLGDIGDNTGQSSVLLIEIRDILNNISAKFESFDFTKLLDAIKDSGGGSGVGSTIGSAIGTVVGNLFSKIIDAIANGDDTVEDAVADLSSRFSGLAETSKTKFPFSLPWDVIAIVSALAADPETPKFEFPFEIESLGISHKIELDFTEFEGLSKASRSFFVLIFAMVLVRLTLMMINRGDLSE